MAAAWRRCPTAHPAACGRQRARARADQVPSAAKAAAALTLPPLTSPSPRWRSSSSTAAGCSPRSTSTTGWASGSALATGGTSRTRPSPAPASGPTATGAPTSPATPPSQTTTGATRRAAWPMPPRSLRAHGAGPTTPATRPSSTSAASCVGGGGVLLWLFACRMCLHGRPRLAQAFSGCHAHQSTACQHLVACSPASLHAAPGNFSYSSNTSNLTYVLSTYNRTFTDANSQCRLAGGSLITYRSLALQLEVEKYYIDMGLLFPFYHRVRRAPGWPAGVWLCRACCSALHSVAQHAPHAPGGALTGTLPPLPRRSTTGWACSPTRGATRSSGGWTP